MTERRKIRWLIAHYPAYLFVRTAEVFRTELEKLCPGQFDLEIHTFDTYVNQYKKLDVMTQFPPEIPGLEEPSLLRPEFKGREVDDFTQVRAKWNTVFQGLRDGDFEMSQTQVNIVGSYLKNDYNALDLPFLFNSHDHVSRVLDGAIGDRLGQELAETADIRGLGFTYSGGYRVIGANKEITKLNDLGETTFLTTTGPSKFLFEELGVGPIDKVEASPSDHGDIQQDGGAIETTYLRFTGKHILKTDHSMFLTTILTGTKFFDSLTTQQQEAFKTAAKTVAKVERIWSVEDAAKYEQDAESKGITIVELGAEDKQRLRHASKQSYKQLMKMKINPVIVDAIIREGKK
jgi:TRAP-type C4-dicarboxylate transport system substrate-binding protein